ncbi:MAG: hypothetical protein HYU70_01965 [Bacteroidetes bacterium]|nr:hypothetical protein [Bacteroidota bacterium]
MKRKTILAIWVFCFFTGGVYAQSIDPVSLILAKAIKAIDLKVQRIQNQTLVLQQVQQQEEQKLSKQKLEEISSWHRQLSALYAGYFSELKQVKPMISGGTTVRRIFAMQQQVALVYGNSQKDPTTKPRYDAILNQSRELVQTLQLVLTGQMASKDAERVAMVGTLKDAMQDCLANMQSLHEQEAEILSDRKRKQSDLRFVKRLYAIQ